MLVRSTIGENLFIHKHYFFTIGCWIMVLWEMLFFWEESIHKCTIVGSIGMLKLYSFSSIPSFFLFLFNSPGLFLSCPFPSSILLFPSDLMSIYSFSKLYFYWVQTHAQFLRGAHRNSVCSHVFIGVSLHACIYVYERLMCTLF